MSTIFKDEKEDIRTTKPKLARRSVNIPLAQIGENHSSAKIIERNRSIQERIIKRKLKLDK